MKTLSIILLTCSFAICQNSFSQESIGSKSSINNLESSAQNRTDCEPIFSFDPAENWPGGLTFDGAHFWASGYGLPTIYKMSIEGDIIDSIPSPSQGNVHGGALAFDGAHLLCVVEQDGYIYRVDPDNGVVIDSFQMPVLVEADDYNGIGVAYDGQFIWHSHHTPDYLLKIDAVTGAPLDTVPLSNQVIGMEYVDGQLLGIDAFFSPIDSIYNISTENGSMLSADCWCPAYTADIAWDGSSLWGVTTIGTAELMIFKMGELSITTEIENLFEEATYLYPNPTNGHFNVGGLNYEILDIIDAKGSHCKFDLNHEQVDISKLPSGVYYVRLLTLNGLETHRVLKK